MNHLKSMMHRISDINFQVTEAEKELTEIEDKRDKLIQHKRRLSGYRKIGYEIHDI
jgi:hypothetical protein